MEKQEFLKKLSEVIDELPQLVDEVSRKTKEIVKYEFQQINKKIAFSPSDKDDILKEYKKRVIGELNVNMINDAGELNVKWYKDFLIQKLNFCSKWEWDSSTPENRLPAPLHMILLPREHVVIEITKVIYNKELIDYCNYHLQHNEAGLGLAATKAKTECDVIAKQLEGKGFIPRGDGAKFISIFFPDGRPFEKVTWLKSRKDCFSLMMEMNDPDIKPKVINKYINQAGIDPKTKKVNTKPLRSQDKQNCTAFLRRLK
ncbi:MAG TPA: hypothetical protein PKI35_06810 [Bacteroidales bacterium]|nr:hypothetical protein [Bacteroidales bacterium]